MLSEYLKILRVKKKLTQKNVADKLGIATSSYTKKENGINPFNIDELKEIKKIFNIEDLEFIKIFFN
ncbi:transcriptional regulator with XRE-family HTH domain [Clostridium beijerinckii]|uniref:Transcriptional regulator with XRE-family HTH domain n=1 Tax=Clostridium beijerinckii TaxID=1520 RepID=A0AAX0B532_CLOBE|nr:helix-turn-helix transcriptional regulator [Clostridium beijerinckii]NRT90126.1 transcriptional regulator with XRE-family HTH domain [Clostridium beijerinckii]NYC69656.1 transcriptional regulator with XRE-family HTH domain [Clostridium beijerinckii]